MRNLRLAVAATLMVAASPTLANAAQLLLNNANFEANQYADGGYRNSAIDGGGPVGWKGTSQNTGTWNPLASAYSDHAVHGTVVSVNSQSQAQANFGATTGISQTVGGGYKIEANTRYTLTFDVGNRADLTTPWGYAFGLVAGDGLATTAGDFVLASISGINDPATGLPIPEGVFRTITLIFETGASGPGIGQALTVGFGGNGATYGAEFDNVHLDATAIETAAIPEPATWALMIVGSGLAGGALRRRRAVLAVA